MARTPWKKLKKKRAETAVSPHPGLSSLFERLEELVDALRVGSESGMHTTRAENSAVWPGGRGLRGEKEAAAVMSMSGRERPDVAGQRYDNGGSGTAAMTSDGNGYMDENELDALLKDLCEKNKKVLDINNIATYKITIMALSDGGKLYRTELALVLCADEN
ncbi:Calbindin [Acipenser ruthenus]|uniref:Calbindin n=1 Tax=Acipenser ruthenus TaxID=7906 RepID=A0A444ULW5_ACIRT|nr:Calbindin [Acipenser ruthenus]